MLNEYVMYRNKTTGEQLTFERSGLWNAEGISLPALNTDLLKK